MQRVLVIGSGGAGKSTSRERSVKRPSSPVVHLDACHWRPGRFPAEGEWTRTIDEIAARPAWIMDGNYGGTLDRRLAACDTVIFHRPAACALPVAGVPAHVSLSGPHSPRHGTRLPREDDVGIRSMDLELPARAPPGHSSTTRSASRDEARCHPRLEPSGRTVSTRTDTAG